MKYSGKILSAFVIILLIVSLFIIGDKGNLISASISLKNSTIIADNRFKIGAAENQYDYNFKYLDTVLGFNLWHSYLRTQMIDGKHYPAGITFWAPNDLLFEPISSYQNDVLGAYQTLAAHNMTSWMPRPKLDYLVYGQRSDYRCVDTLFVDHDLWFYTFQSPSHVGTDIPEVEPYGSSNYVRYCRSINSLSRTGKTDKAGYVVSRLRTNAEQCHRGHDIDAWRWDSEHDWFIKPRIRIDSSFAHNSPEEEVCQIKIIAQDGVTLLRDVTLKGKNFLDAHNHYDGRYLEDYYNLPANDSLIIHGDWGDTWAFNARGNNLDDTYNNKTDIQVYWYGNCDMWIDRVRVDNDIAKDLLTTDNSNVTHNMYMNWLKWEAERIACLAGEAANKFYIELFEFNQIPCMAFVNHALDSLCSKHIDLITVQFTFYQYHMAWIHRGRIMKPDQIIRQYVNKVGSNEILCGHLPFTSIEENTYSRIPETLPIHSGARILATTLPPAEYDAWMQANLDSVSNFDEGGSLGDKNAQQKFSLIQHNSSAMGCAQMPQFEGKYRFEMKLGSEISKQANIPFTSWIQANQYFIHCGEIEREPTSEEMDLLSNLPVAYGTKGVIFFSYIGSYWNPTDYAYSFTEPDGATPRYTNVYGQPKWVKFISIIKRLKQWSPYIMSFDNTKSNSYIYRFAKDRNALIDNSYIDKLVTLKPGDLALITKNSRNGNSNNQKQSVEDFQDQTFLQVSTFKELAASNRLYFMIVNKRCSPFIDESTEANLGGKRWVNIFFKSHHAEMDGSNIWTIKDVANPGWSVTFDKTLNGFVELGEFMPGEGKMYLMTPDSSNIPLQFNLYQNYPNPFNPVTKIRFSLPTDANVVIKVFDVIGREVKTIVNEFRNRGFYEEQFEGKDFASGVYFYRIESGNYSVCKKMVLIK